MNDLEVIIIRDVQDKGAHDKRCNILLGDARQLLQPYCHTG